MNFYQSEFLTSHIMSVLDFYLPNVVDKNGGFHHNFYDNGDVFSAGDKHLVSSTRLIINFAQAWRLFEDVEFKSLALHGLRYLESQHWDESNKNYVWTFNNYQIENNHQFAYGYAFILLTYARCLSCGVIKDSDKLYQIYTLLEARFWQEEYSLYADELYPDNTLSNYRGQNANMHLCEAMLAAYEATNDITFLNRAELLATNVCLKLTVKTNDFVWEHFTTQFEPDWHYNKNDPKNLYRPWGFQPGHQTEWSKLLLWLNKFRPNRWLVNKAAWLFDQAMEKAWDNDYGGIVYGFSPDYTWCDKDKYFWVQAESFAAAAMLYKETGESRYLTDYQNIWSYCWRYMIDHHNGAWFRVLNRQNSPLSNVKSSAGAKCDYHTVGACLDVLTTLS